MNEIKYKLLETIYIFIKENADIVSMWGENEGISIDFKQLLTYKPYRYHPKIGNEINIYVFFNKLISNILLNEPYELVNLTYLEANFNDLIHLALKNEI